MEPHSHVLSALDMCARMYMDNVVKTVKENEIELGPDTLALMHTIAPLMVELFEQILLDYQDLGYIEEDDSEPAEIFDFSAIVKKPANDKEAE